MGWCRFPARGTPILAPARYAGVRAQRFDQVVDGASQDLVDVSLHDDRLQALVDAAPAFQQARNEAPGPQFRDREFQVAGLLGHPLCRILRSVGALLAAEDAHGALHLSLDVRGTAVEATWSGSVRHARALRVHDTGFS